MSWRNTSSSNTAINQGLLLVVIFSVKGLDEVPIAFHGGGLYSSFSPSESTFNTIVRLLWMSLPHDPLRRLSHARHCSHKAPPFTFLASKSVLWFFFSEKKYQAKVFDHSPECQYDKVSQKYQTLTIFKRCRGWGHPSFLRKKQNYFKLTEESAARTATSLWM